MVRVGAVLNLLGAVIALFGLTMIVPLVVSFWLEDGATHAYDEALVLALGSGAALWFATRRRKAELTPRDGILMVLLTWLSLPLVASLPLYIHIAELSFTDAFFEATSGLTATGATVLSGLDELPPSINLWRALLHWIGGLGIIVLAVAILPVLGVGGRQIFRAETPGPLKETRLTPRVTETAKGFWIIYVFFTALAAMAYYLAGMSGFDAVVHAFSTLALGGFSSHDASLGYFNSPAIEIIAIVFMLVAALSYATHFVAWRSRSLRCYLRDAEARAFITVLAVSVLGVATVLWWNGVYAEFATALRHAAFNVASVATTLGFSTVDYAQWPIFAPLWMLFLCAFATCSGSTGGGIKMMRALVMVKQMMRETKLLLHPHARVPIRLGRDIVPNQAVFAVLAFMTIYGASIAILVLAMTLSGLDLLTALSATVASINNTGPGLARVGPATTYAVLTDLQTWLLTIAMLLGRLELLTFLVVFTPGFWRQ
ncbi:MAG: potassium transporter Trk [Betaproteobacteria bacterium RBG_16_64_9]|nr:MAG: potassium transporter Trk [Betaproteobacteria bacterium RBG_16_64_9]